MTVDRGVIAGPSPRRAAQSVGGREWRAVRRAARVLARGGVIAYPTEGVFGLGCDPEDAAALERILRLKRRSRGKGLILIGSRPEHLEAFVGSLPGTLRELLVSDPAVPTTWILPSRSGTPAALTGGGGRIAVRITTHPVAAALCEVFGRAIVSTSANRSGAPPARDPLRARLTVGAAVDFVVFAPCGGHGRPSRIVDATSGRVLRE